MIAEDFTPPMMMMTRSQRLELAGGGSSGRSMSVSQSYASNRLRDREEWLSQWSRIWTKRQSPEWKPRRASVATCGNQQHPSLVATNYSTKLASNQLHQRLSEASVKELLRRQIQVKARSCIPLTESSVIQPSKETTDCEFKFEISNTGSHSNASIKTQYQEQQVEQRKQQQQQQQGCCCCYCCWCCYQNTSSKADSRHQHQHHNQHQYDLQLTGVSVNSQQAKQLELASSSDLTLAGERSGTSCSLSTSVLPSAQRRQQQQQQLSTDQCISFKTSTCCQPELNSYSSMDKEMILVDAEQESVVVEAAEVEALPNGRKLSEKTVPNNVVAELDGLRLQSRQRKSLIHSMALNRMNNSSNSEFSGRKVSQEFQYLQPESNGVEERSDETAHSDQDQEETVSVSCSPLETQLPDLAQLYRLGRSSKNSLTLATAPTSTLATSTIPVPTAVSTTCCHRNLASATNATDVDSVVLGASQATVEEVENERKTNISRDSLNTTRKELKNRLSSSSSSEAAKLKTRSFQEQDIVNGSSEKSNRQENIIHSSKSNTNSIMHKPCTVVAPKEQEEKVDRLRSHHLAETTIAENHYHRIISISSSSSSSRSSSSSSSSSGDEDMNENSKQHNQLELNAHHPNHSAGSCDLERDENLSEIESEEMLDSEVEAVGRLEVDEDDDELLVNSARHHCYCQSGTTSAIQFGQHLLSGAKSLDEELKQCYDNNNLDNRESQIVESWLDDHPAFMEDYFMRKASRRLIDSWLITHAKVSNHLPGQSLSGSNSSQQATSSSCQQQYGLHNLTNPSADLTGASQPFVLDKQRIFDSIPIVEHQQTSNHPLQGGSLNSTRVSLDQTTNFRPPSSGRSFSQSGHATPVRKISATDFESKTGSGFLRPMVSTTPDGRQTFLSLTSNEIQAAEDLASPLDNLNVGPNSGSQSNLLLDYSSISRKTSENNNDLSSLNVDELDCLKSGKHQLPHSEFSESEEDTEGLASSRDEVKLIFELVKNICNDLDIRTLLHKILKNIAVLINADKSSLFLVRGQPGDPNRHLVSQLFNVDQDSEVPVAGGALASWNEGEDDCISIPWGTGLVGYVAESGESVNISNCYDDPRFTSTIDQRTGYVTRHMLCAPILDKRNEIVGVAQVINKRDGNPFTRADELKFKRYLQFCGIGLRNAQSYENCQLENRRNQVLLDLARMVFEEQSTIEQVVYRIMLHTQSLLECERCQVLLTDDGSEDLDQLLHLPVASQQPLNSQPHLAAPIPPTSPADNVKPPEWRPQCSKRETHDERLNFRSRTRKLVNSANNLLAPPPPPSATSEESQKTKLFSLVFDLECDGNDPVMHSNKEAANGSARVEEPTLGRSKFPINIGITGYVAMTGETLNIEDAHKNERFDPSVDVGSTFRHKSILCMPIRNGQRQIIGVSQLINKKNGRPFNKNDEDLFEAFAIFCGLGIHNTLMYEKVLKIMAKQRVTFEVLSYHATAPLEEAKKLNMSNIPSCFALNLMSLKFNDFSLDEQFMLKSCLRFFLDLDLMRRFQIDQLVFCNWILSVQKNYRKVTYHPIVGGNGLKETPVRYHNWRHAFNVSQMMFAILINTQICQPLGELETLALLIACLCHDLDHRGTNNSFQIKSASPLAQLYSTSTMEHHHFDQCVMILNSQGNQILANLSPEEYSRVIVLLEEAILATDLANYIQKREHFFQLVNGNQFEWHSNAEHRSLLRCMLMTACDVAAITKPWPVQKVVADLVMSEFYQQGDIERQELNIEPSDMMNRDKMAKLPEMQIGFIDSVCAPIYAAFASLFPRELKPLLEGCISNRNLWAELAKNNDANQASEINSAQLCYLNQNKYTSTPTISLLPHNSYSKNLSETNLYNQTHNHNHHSNSPTCDQRENEIPCESRASSALTIDVNHTETSKIPISEYRSSTITNSLIDEQRKSV